jgi:osmoprotectant transport system ATP-binding protein
LQEELLALLKRLRKTVLLVTHDVQEAVRLGDSVALMRSGRLVQHAAPAEMLAHPADGFVAAFLGADRALTRLGLFRISDVPRDAAAVPGEPLPEATTLRDALSAMLERGVRALPVAEGGSLSLEAVLRSR